MMTKFIPKVGEKYWSVAVDVEHDEKPWVEEFFNGQRFNFCKPFKSNCFRTKREATEAARKIKKILTNR